MDLVERRDRNKKRHGVLLGMLVLFFGLLTYMVLRVDPESIKNFLIPNIYLPFLIVLMGFLFFLFSVLLLSAQKAVWWAVGITSYFVLKFLGLGNVFNALLILLILVSKEVYFYKGKQTDL